MTAYLSPAGILIQEFDNNGNVLSGGLIYTYVAGTTTPVDTFTDSTLSVKNANPITLDSAGRLPGSNEIWVPANTPHKIVIKDSGGNSLESIDNILGLNDPTPTLASLAGSGSGSGADLVANAVKSYSTLTALRSAPVPSLVSGQTLVVIVEGGSVAGDGSGGQFYWNSSSTAADDGVNVIEPNSAPASGRYLVIPQANLNAYRDFFVAGPVSLTRSTSQQSLLGTIYSGSQVIPVGTWKTGKYMKFRLYGSMGGIDDGAHYFIVMNMIQGTVTTGGTSPSILVATDTSTYGVSDAFDIDIGFVCSTVNSGTATVSANGLISPMPFLSGGTAMTSTQGPYIFSVSYTLSATSTTTFDCSVICSTTHTSGGSDNIHSYQSSLLGAF